MGYKEIIACLTDQFSSRKQNELDLIPEDANTFTFQAGETLYALNFSTLQLLQEGDLYVETPDMNTYLKVHFFNGRLSQIQQPVQISLTQIPKQERLVVARMATDEEVKKHLQRQHERSRFLRSPRRGYNKDDIG